MELRGQYETMRVEQLPVAVYQVSRVVLTAPNGGSADVTKVGVLDGDDWSRHPA